MVKTFIIAFLILTVFVVFIIFGSCFYLSGQLSRLEEKESKDDGQAQ